MASEPIRIVALYPGTPVIAPPTAQLSYRGGPLLTAVEVFTVFWGTPWLHAQAQTAQQINDFFRYVVGSPLLDQLTEYSTSGMAIGHGTVTGTATITDRPLRRTVSDAQIQAAIQAWIGSRRLPVATANSLYFVYLPPGVTADLGGQRSCRTFCGYHDHIGGSIFYAVMPFPNCSGCAGGLATFDAITSTSSHELCEAITDPIPGQGWYDDVNGEIGDICAWQTRKIDRWTVQLEWSNRAKACV